MTRATSPEIFVRGLPSGYELEHLTRVFYPGAALRQGLSTRGLLVYARVGGKRLAAGVRTPEGRRVRTVPVQDGPPLKRQLSRLLYDLLCEVTGLHPPWGMLTGVRPVRLLRNSMKELGPEGARSLLRDFYGVSEEKLTLAEGIVRVQAPVLEASPEKGFSLYISIPFCPSRCTYCSYVSQTVGRDFGLMDEYLGALERELAVLMEITRTMCLLPETVYIGGGTPTSLSASQLERLLRMVAGQVDTSVLREYTVEAGRPDCTDYEKLLLLKTHGVGRISINPQSFSPEVLQAIGRAHSEGDIHRCFEDARRAGHVAINMDLIAGLPGDDTDGFSKSLGKALALGPENITLHTLTLKRGTDLTRREGQWASPAGQMLRKAYPRLEAAGYEPYYLYRQKSTVENLENTGWTRPCHEGLYNILMMEETRPVLAVGAGASTKLVAGDGAVIKRIYNTKYPADYIRNIDKALDKKKGVAIFYARNVDPQKAR